MLRSHAGWLRRSQLNDGLGCMGLQEKVLFDAAESGVLKPSQARSSLAASDRWQS